MNSFQPLPLLGNPHVQTILGNLLGGRPGPLHSTKHLIALPDGDQIVVHESSPGVTANARIAILVHGLGGSHQSSYIERTTHRLNALGWRVFRMNLRAAGDGIQLARRFYNAASSADVGAVVDHVSAAFPQTPLAVVGFSLGGNIVLKYAGELADRSPSALSAVAALAPPIDLLRCSQLIDKHPFYDAFYVRHLTAQVALHQQHFPDLPRVNFPRRMVLRQFDDLYTAPRGGYADAVDYYGDASSFSKIGAIRVPTFILTARDDPFVAVEPFEELAGLTNVDIHIAARGGHLGFLGKDGAGGIRWAETQVVNWLQKTLGEPGA